MATKSIKVRSAWVGVGLGMGVSVGCLVARPDPDHCMNREGNKTCAELHPGELTYCSTCVFTAIGDGCVAERPADDACYSPCGDGMRSGDEALCPAGASSSSGEESTTGEETTIGTESGSESSESTTGPMPCVGNEDCPETAAPFCEPVSGECVACDGTDDPDGACAGVDPGLPLCVGGACVQCTAAAPEACEGMTPVCDDASNTCVPCTAHEECVGGAACNLFTGACLPSDAVLHVGPGQMYGTLTEAVETFATGAEGTIVVHEPMASYDEAITVDGGRVLAFLAAEDVTVPPGWVRTAGGSPQLTVADGTVLVDGLRLTANTSSMHPGVLVDGGRAWVDRSHIVRNDGGGIAAQAGAELVLRNCFVGDGTSSANGLTVDNATTNAVYTTFGSGFDGFDDIFPVACIAPVDVAIRNSVLVSFDNVAGEISCSTSEVTNTASETAIPGMGNVALGDIEADWFVDVSVGNFHLDSPPAPLTNAARWEDGDPPTDIDGQLRPAVDGTTDYAGADVP